MKYLTYFSRLIVGILFIFSGLIKANDTIGFSYKLEEYFSADVLNLEFLIPLALVMAAVICVFEVVAGIMVLIGSRPKLTNWSLMLMIIFFTFLTFYSAYFDKVTDCGCFGDAIKLTPWGSFIKDVILIFFISILFMGERHIKALFNRKMENMFLAIITFFSFAFIFHTYRHLPIKDFRPYSIGKNIYEGMKTCDELELPCTEEAYYYVVKNKVTGEVSEMLSTDYQDNWEEFDFVETTDKTMLIQQGYEPPINDFSIFKDGTDYTYSILDEENAFLLVCYDINQTSTSAQKEINAFYADCQSAGVSFYALCASSDDNILNFKKKNKIEYPFYFTDETTLKTMIRANPGLIHLQKGTIMGKWHHNDFPSFSHIELQ